MKNASERLAIGEALSKKPPKNNLPGQKFPRGVRVRTSDKAPPTYSGFQKGVEAIIQYSYGQQYGGDAADSYNIIELDESGEIIGEVSWFDESELTLIDANIDKGMLIIEKYKKEQA